MTQEPKLLTEQEAACVLMMEPAKAMAELRERGLIVPDPDVEEARKIAVKVCEDHGENTAADFIRRCSPDQSTTFAAALAALRRDIELAQPKLTRERVREAVIDTIGIACVELSDFTDDNAFDEHKQDAEGFVIRLHAALTGGTDA